MLLLRSSGEFKQKYEESCIPIKPRRNNSELQLIIWESLAAMWNSEIDEMRDMIYPTDIVKMREKDCRLVQYGLPSISRSFSETCTIVELVNMYIYVFRGCTWIFVGTQRCYEKWFHSYDDMYISSDTI